MQVTDNLVEGGGERVIDVTKDAVCFLKLESLAQIPDDSVECLGRRDLGHPSSERGCTSDSLEFDDDLV